MGDEGGDIRDRGAAVSSARSRLFLVLESLVPLRESEDADVPEKRTRPPFDGRLTLYPFHGKVQKSLYFGSMVTW
ncbi:hypothetical protein [Cohnella zeiphila]|uniref:Uncharacterized protein n=1 Tax=Cohnella zeiphila TaxID=2761120 RepID=A0A7X0VYH4_9BACL|nr:hypothetical protein [Cohnella zeiphila]MBB6735369.1 hypothetical protein [Cohnella zeiphila]